MPPAAAPATTSKPNLYDVAPTELLPLLREVVSPPFRVMQVADWLHRKGAESFQAMTNLPADLRQELTARFTVEMPGVVHRTIPGTDGTQKYLFTLGDGSLIESVYMPMLARRRTSPDVPFRQDEHQSDASADLHHTTLCLSSQAGCAVGCTFCVTGFFGAGRNLTPSEMVGQFLVIRNEKAIPDEKLNIVFMGMGEPLLNLDNLEVTLEILFQRIPARRITVSTSGIIPGIDALAKLSSRPNLAISINAPDRQRREEIMPITKKYPLEELIDSLRRFPLESRREITIEYVLLADFNSSVADARALARLIRGLRAKVNVIPFNPDPNLPDWMKRPSDAGIDDFVDTLVGQDVRVTVRRSKGRDVAAACGQLRGKMEKKGKAT